MMWLRNAGLGLGLALLLGTGFVGCSDADVPTELERSAPLLANSTDKPLRVVPGSTSSKKKSTSAVIDWNGGELKLAGHMLSVPRFAVSEPTLFTMDLLPGDTLGVELKALQKDDAGEWTVDVGKQGFAEPLNLKLSYKSAEGEIDPSALRVAWRRDNPSGTLTSVGNDVDPDKQWIKARLEHFSAYLVASI